MSQLNQLRAKIAEQIGVDPDQIKDTDPRWVQLMKEGVLVQLHIGRWRAKTRLTWADLGIEVGEKEDEQLQEILNLGYKRLLPAKVLKELDAIESAARKWLEKKSFRTHWGFFVPVTAYEEWKEENETHITRYFEARDDLVRDYDEIIKQVVRGYRMAAAEAYNRLRLLSPDQISKFKSQAEFVDTFVNNVTAHIESAIVIRESFYFNVELKYIPLPSLLAEDQAEAERIAGEAETNRLKVEAEQGLIRAEASAREAKIDVEVRMARSAAEHKDALMREMHQDVVKQARRQKEQLIDSFLQDVVVQLRDMVWKASTDVLGAITKHDRLPPRSVVQLKHLIDQVQSLNFYGDTEINTMIDGIRPYLDKSAEARDLEQIAGNLQNIATVVRASLIGLGQTPRQTRDNLNDLGIPERPTQEMVRQARTGLGLAEVTTAASTRQQRSL